MEQTINWLKGTKISNSREKKSMKIATKKETIKWFSRYPIPKSGISAEWTSPFCRFLASFSFRYDITDAILQGIEKMKAHYLKNLLLDLFEILQAFRSKQRNLA